MTLLEIFKLFRHIYVYVEKEGRRVIITVVYIYISGTLILGCTDTTLPDTILK